MEFWKISTVIIKYDIITWVSICMEIPPELNIVIENVARVIDCTIAAI